MFKLLKLMILGVFVLVSAGAALAQTEVEATAKWGPPIYGGPVAHYIVELSVDGGGWTTVGTPSTTELTFSIRFNGENRVRVAGVDAEGRQGPYSLPSNTYNPSDGAVTGPAQPGQPTLF